MKPYRFIMIGSGWRAMYYVRIAKALPQLFELCAMYCRTKEKAELMRKEYGIPATSDQDLCLGMNPDFAVVAVSKKYMAETAASWSELGIPVLAETPAGLDEKSLNRLRLFAETGRRYAVAEQYCLYPGISALLKLIDRGIIGEPVSAYISFAHEYHGASLIRRFLNVSSDMPFFITAQQWDLPVTETLTRYERVSDGHLVTRSRLTGAFAFENGKAALYDFDSEQYRSPIRGNVIRVEGTRGEIMNETVRWLDQNNEPCLERLIGKRRHVRRDSDNPNFQEIIEVEQIRWQDEIIYDAPYGLCGLSEDETAMAMMLEKMGKYARDEGPAPYPLKDAIRDAEMALSMRRAINTGSRIRSL